MDYIELIIFAIVVLFSLLAGDRKKKQQQRQQRPPVRPRHPPPRQADRPVAQARPVPPQPRRVAAKSEARTLAEEIFEQLKARHGEEMRRDGGFEIVLERETEFEPEPLHTEEARSLELTRPEAQSLETLEGAGEASHKRFHDKYITPPKEILFPEPAKPREFSRPATNPRTAREAIKWMAILGKPKGLE